MLWSSLGSLGCRFLALHSITLRVTVRKARLELFTLRASFIQPVLFDYLSAMTMHNDNADESCLMLDLGLDAPRKITNDLPRDLQLHRYSTIFPLFAINRSSKLSSPVFVTPVLLLVLHQHH